MKRLTSSHSIFSHTAALANYRTRKFLIAAVTRSKSRAPHTGIQSRKNNKHGSSKKNLQSSASQSRGLPRPSALQSTPPRSHRWSRLHAVKSLQIAGRSGLSHPTRQHQTHSTVARTPLPDNNSAAHPSRRLHLKL